MGTMPEVTQGVELGSSMKKKWIATGRVKLSGLLEENRWPFNPVYILKEEGGIQAKAI